MRFRVLLFEPATDRLVRDLGSLPDIDRAGRRCEEEQGPLVFQPLPGPVWRAYGTRGRYEVQQIDG